MGWSRCTAFDVNGKSVSLLLAKGTARNCPPLTTTIVVIGINTFDDSAIKARGASQICTNTNELFVDNRSLIDVWSHGDTV